MKNYLLFSFLLSLFSWGSAQEELLRYHLQEGDKLFYKVEIQSEKLEVLQEVKFEVDSIRDGCYTIRATIEKIEGLGEEEDKALPAPFYFKISSSGKLLQDLSFVGTDQSAQQHMDIRHYFLEYPPSEISLNESWKTGRAIEEIVFDSVNTTHTLKEVHPDYCRIDVLHDYAESTKAFQKTISGEYLVESKRGIVIRADLENKSFTGFSHIRGQISIAKWNPEAPPVTEEMELKRFAESFADSHFDDEQMVKRSSVFIMNEANLPTYQKYRELEGMGLFRMKQIDSVTCCKTFDIQLTEKGRAFVVDSIFIENAFSPIVKTYSCDSLKVSEIIAEADYYEIKYEVFNLQPTLFVKLSHLGTELTGLNYKSSCFVRKVNGGWQIDKDKQFKGYPDKNGKY